MNNRSDEGGVRMPPEIKAAMALSCELWAINLKLGKKNLLGVERENLEQKADALRAEWLDVMSHYEYEREGCQSCFGTGWSLYETRHSMKGFSDMQVTKTAPCECELGRQFDKSYAIALEGRRRRQEQARPKRKQSPPAASDIEF